MNNIMIVLIFKTCPNLLCYNFSIITVIKILPSTHLQTNPNDLSINSDYVNYSPIFAFSTKNSTVFWKRKSFSSIADPPKAALI